MSWRKIIRLGTRPHVGSVFCKIEYSEKDDGKGRLSITGVEGPKSNGDCRGSCGQLDMHLGNGVDIVPAPKWTLDGIARFLDVWRTWHLNDMRASCEHQRANWNPSEAIELITYRLTAEALREQNRIKDALHALILKGKMVTATPGELAVLALPWETHHVPDADSPASGQYEVNKREMKTAGWVYPSQHPRGLLTKPCDACGYKYGSAWLYEEVPADVLTWLQALPDTDMTPAWV